MSPRLAAVLLPGLDGTGQLLGRFAQSAPPAFNPRIFRYPTAKTLDYPQLEKLVGSQLPKHAPFVLIAESYSGPVAIRVAAQGHPGLRSVVLVATFATPPAPSVLRRLPWWALTGIHAPASALRFFLGRQGSDVVRDVRAAVRDVSPRVLAARVRQTLDVDVLESLRAVSVPILYLRARRDRIVPLRCLEAIQAVRPETVVKTLDAPHLVLYHEPEAAWDHIDRFLNSQRAR